MNPAVGPSSRLASHFLDDVVIHLSGVTPGDEMSRALHRVSQTAPCADPLTLDEMGWRAPRLEHLRKLT
jgi:hypothetical protein